MLFGNRYSNLLLPIMHFTRLLLAGSILLVLQLATFYLFQFKLKIVAENNKLIIYKNSEKIIDTKISYIRNYQTADLYTKRMASEMKLNFVNNKPFYFSLLVVYFNKAEREERIDKFVDFLILFNKNYNFKQERHMTQLGPSKNLFDYVNQNLRKNE